MQRSTLIKAMAGYLGLTLLAFALAVPATAQSTQQQMQCFQLEQELQRVSQGGSNKRAQLVKIQQEMAKYDRIYQQGQAELERRDCYDYFLFSQSVRATPQCLGIQKQIDNAKRRLTRLERMRESAADETAQQNRQDAIIAELARWRCGPQYAQQARKLSNNGFSLWNDSEGSDPGLAPYGDGTGLGYTTYRTICVRLCDGYYFPISYATVPESFSRDANACSSQCAAPAELYYYQNPGANVEQATSLTGTPYTKLKNAWLYRKEYVRGCSCKVAEYAEGAPADQTSSTGEPVQTDAAPATDAIGALIDGEQVDGADQ
ncbi:MAG: DUF2865 domain-containing protein [Hyphomicrobiaceae bacterium]